MQRLDRLNNTPDTNIRVYKNTPSYDYLALTKLDIEHIIEFIPAPAFTEPNRRQTNRSLPIEA